jgi:hypothetical protein
MIEALLASYGVWVLIPSAFWMLMIFDCVRNEPDRQTWLWILMFLNVAGAAVYFFACYLPRSNVGSASYFKRWTLRQALWNAEAGVRNIGKAHQYLTLGNVLADMGNPDKAAEAYQQAIEKDPQNTHALFGLACVEMQMKQFANAKPHLQHLLKLDPNHKSGEASLMYGKALFELKDWQAAKVHLAEDIRYWSHPESSVLIAIIHKQDGETQQSRDCLETMLAKVKASPMYHYRRHQRFVNQATKLLKTL